MKFQVNIKNSMIDSTSWYDPKQHSPIVAEMIALVQKHNLIGISYSYDDKLVSDMTKVTIVCGRTPEQSTKEILVETIQPRKTVAQNPTDAVAAATTKVGKVRAWMFSYRGHDFPITVVMEKTGLKRRECQDILWKLWNCGELESDTDGVYRAPLKGHSK